MARRRKYNKRSPIWPWVSFIVFGAIIALLGYSVITKTSPAKVISSLFSSDLPADDLRRLNKDELIERIGASQGVISDLESQLADCKNDDGYTKGIIETSSPTLNLRSDPSLESDIIFKIPTNSKVSILYYDEKELLLDGAMSKWCKVSYADQEGWVWGNYLREVE